MKILIVDDSVVFRTQITSALKGIPGAEVIGSAANGKIAIQKIELGGIDLITLDMEMPEMDGLATIKVIKEKRFPVKIIVFSSETIRGAEKALDALAAGADEVVPKPVNSGSIDSIQKIIKESLMPIISKFLSLPIEITRQEGELHSSGPSVKSRKNLENFFPKAVVIASSTGGPGALDTIFSGLKGPFSIPIFITQHMPPVFTQIFSKRLENHCGVPAAEGKNFEKVSKNRIYVAPGGFHMSLKRRDDEVVVLLDERPLRNSVRPAADYLFETAAEIYGGNLLAIVLTGMGEDGAQGAKMVHENNGGIIIQDRNSCVVFGMPGALYRDGSYDKIMNLQELILYLKTVLV